MQAVRFDLEGGHARPKTRCMSAVVNHHMFMARGPTRWLTFGNISLPRSAR
jgi:hypothetical protein